MDPSYKPGQVAALLFPKAAVSSSEKNSTLLKLFSPKKSVGSKSPSALSSSVAPTTLSTNETTSPRNKNEVRDQQKEKRKAKKKKSKENKQNLSIQSSKNESASIRKNTQKGEGKRTENKTSEGTPVNKKDTVNLLKELGVKTKVKQKEKQKKSDSVSVLANGNDDAISSQNSSSFEYTHETLLPKSPPQSTKKKVMKRKLEKTKKDDDDEHIGKRPRRDRKRDRQADKRTVFVGNCPLTVDKKRLKKLFREYGEIETIRFRCAPAAEPQLPRRAIVITKNFHDQCSNYVAYVVFKEEGAAKKALAKNGFLIDDLHLRVDIAALSKKHDKKRSIFVGNLSFTIKEEEIREHFLDCGEVTNVRIVRDRQTSLGKGICYVQFESKDSVSLALKLNKSDLQGRQIRVMVCTNKPKVKEEKKGGKTKSSDEKAKAKPKKIMFAPSNVSSSGFKGILTAKREKRFRKLKKKKDNAKKTDGLSAIFDDAAPVPKKGKLKKGKAGDKKKRVKSKGSFTAKKGQQSKGNVFKGKSKGKGNKKMGKENKKIGKGKKV